MSKSRFWLFELPGELDLEELLQNSKAKCYPATPVHVGELRVRQDTKEKVELFAIPSREEKQ